MASLTVAPPSTTPELTPRLRMAIARLARMLRGAASAETGLSQGLASALATVVRSGPLTIGSLAEQERVQPPSMTRIVARLESEGLVAREADGRDRRVTRVRATDAGQAFLAAMRTRRNELLAERLRTLSPDDIEAIERALPAIERLAGLA